MHRSGSWSRASEYYMSGKPASSSVAVAAAGIRVSAALELEQEKLDHQERLLLPVYHPSAMMEKEKDNKSHRDNNKTAEKAVHAIPFVLMACALLLWLFSDPDVEVVGVRVNSSASSGGGAGLTLVDGDIEHDSDGTQTLPIPLDIPKPPRHDHLINFRSRTTTTANTRLRTTLTYS